MNKQLEDMDIADLRKMAKVLNIPAERTWDKAAFLHAIDRNRKGRALARLVIEEDEEIAPGYVRIRIYKDEQGSDSPVPVLINRFQTRLPRDVLIDVPREVLEVLNNSTHLVTVKVTDKSGVDVTTTRAVRTYNYDKVGESSGKSGAVSPLVDPQSQGYREQFRALFRRWPTHAQERDFKDAMMARTAREAGLFDSESLDALSTSKEAKKLEQ